ncbi:RTA1-domain-containing protein [Auricularia subglabra TFB-10046 SS5]|nr:RTA1-domain-containing protein [Auricularia subglabra TFB-10046 SS5]
MREDSTGALPRACNRQFANFKHHPFLKLVLQRRVGGLRGAALMCRSVAEAAPSAPLILDESAAPQPVLLSIWLCELRTPRRWRLQDASSLVSPRIAASRAWRSHIHLRAFFTASTSSAHARRCRGKGGGLPPPASRAPRPPLSARHVHQDPTPLLSAFLGAPSLRMGYWPASRFGRALDMCNRRTRHGPCARLSLLCGTRILHEWPLRPAFSFSRRPRIKLQRRARYEVLIRSPRMVRSTASRSAPLPSSPPTLSQLFLGLSFKAISASAIANSCGGSALIMQLLHALDPGHAGHEREGRALDASCSTPPAVTNIAVSNAPLGTDPSHRSSEINDLSHSTLRSSTSPRPRCRRRRRRFGVRHRQARLGATRARRSSCSCCATTSRACYTPAFSQDVMQVDATEELRRKARHGCFSQPSIPLSLGGVSETLGWSARLWSSISPTLKTPFLIQIVTTINAPTFLVAANFIVLGRVVRLLGPQYSRLSPAMYSIVFLTADNAALIVQAVGGGQAAAAGTLEGANRGAKVMLGGIVLQFVAIIVYVALALEFLLRYTLDKPLRTPTVKRGALDRKLRTMVLALGVSTLFILVRTVYRTIELTDGWTGKIISNETLFNVLDGMPIAGAMYTLNVFHPGRLVFNEGRRDRDGSDEKVEMAGLRAGELEAARK